ncbi:hypothetical protein CMI37_02800 [Candidatus Pacearchaeota archaeon]|nr:hypothetical protein [Candidatus Pacearchaeota archaeon]
MSSNVQDLDGYYRDKFSQIHLEERGLARLDPLCEEIIEKAKNCEDEQLAKWCRQSVTVALYDNWLAPIPIDESYTLPSFPVDVLPDWMKNWVTHVARSYQVDRDLPAMIALGLYAGAMARRVCVSPRPGWVEQICLYQMIILPPGEGKSPVFSEARKPLADTENELISFHRPEIAKKLAEKRALEQQLAKLEKDLSRETDNHDRQVILRDCVAMRIEIEEIGNPTEPRLYCDDTTPERLAALMSENNCRIIMPSSESDGLITAIGRYAESPNLGIILKAWSGEDTRIDRMGKAPTILERPALNIVITAQPSAVDQLLSIQGFRGRGLADRFLYATPRTLAGQRKSNSTQIPADVSQEYAGFMSAAWSMLDTAYPRIMELSEKASARYNKFLDEIEPRLSPDGEYAPIVGFCNKLKSYVLRFSAILNSADTHSESGPVRDKDVDAACQIADYYIQHSYRVLDDAPVDKTASRARRVSSWIKRERVTSFTMEEAGAPLRDAEGNADIQRALNYLSNHNQIRLDENLWQVNPLLLPSERV